MSVRVLGQVHRGYEPDLGQRILASMAPAEGRIEGLCELDTDVGRAFARAAAAAVKKLGLKRVDLIGSHGQTICHLPPGGALQARAGRGISGNARGSAGTLQIGDPAIIATRLRAPVVSHFRQADVAVGGQGAPVTPWTDYVLFRHPQRNRVIQNIGGIANLTWLPAGRGVDQVVAFDTGPGNMVIDALVRRFTRSREHFDRHGRRAARGRPDAVVLKHLLAHPFLSRRPPKSCGREDFGEAWVQQVIKSHARRRVQADNWIATATALTAASIARAYRRFLSAGRSRGPRIDEVFVCGGGAYNPSIVSSLADHMLYELDMRVEDLSIRTTADLGISPQAKEAVSFAMLAAACVDGVSANLPRVTGARRQIVLGQVCDPEPRR